VTVMFFLLVFLLSHYITRKFSAKKLLRSQSRALIGKLFEIELS